MGRPYKIVFSEEETQEIIQKYQNGIAKNALAKEKNVSVSVINRILVENDIDIRGIAEANGKEIPIEHEHIVISNYLDKKQGLSSAGKEFGYSQKVVETILKRNGIKKRSYEESKQQQRRYQCNDEFFKTPSSNMAYILGFMAADGSIAKKENGIFINLNAIDGEILEKIRIITESTRPISYYIKNTTQQHLCKFSVWSAEWKRDLAKYNIVPAKTFILKPPTLLPSKYYKDFIRGYFDADGCVMIRKNKIAKNKPLIKIDGASKAMMDWIRDILANQYHIYTPSYHTKVCSDAGTIMYSYAINAYDMIEKFYHLMYDDNPELFLKRKKDKFDSLLNTPRDSSSSI